MKRYEKILKENIVIYDIVPNWDDPLSYGVPKAIVECMKESAWQAWKQCADTVYSIQHGLVGTPYSDYVKMHKEAFEKWWNEELKEENK